MPYPATALITGASAGIGADLARLFAQDKHDVILVARREDKLQALAAELEGEFKVKAFVIAADLASVDAAHAIFDQVQTLDRHVEFLVNNAGFGTNGAFWDLPLDREVDQVQVNVTSLLQLTRLFLPDMVAAKRGHVLNIASTAGFQGGPYMATYYATKAFVVTFTEAIAAELKGTGVTATAHCPGATYSEFAQTAGTGSTRLFQGAGVATSQDVAKDAYQAMMRGRVIQVHGFMNKVGVFATRFAPRAMTTSIASKLNRPPGE